DRLFADVGALAGVAKDRFAVAGSFHAGPLRAHATEGAPRRGCGVEGDLLGEDLRVLDDGREAVAGADVTIHGDDAVDRDRIAHGRRRLRGDGDVVGARGGIARAVPQVKVGSAEDAGGGLDDRGVDTDGLAGEVLALGDDLGDGLAVWPIGPRDGLDVDGAEWLVRGLHRLIGICTHVRTVCARADARGVRGRDGRRAAVVDGPEVDDGEGALERRAGEALHLHRSA